LAKIAGPAVALGLGLTFAGPVGTASAHECGWVWYDDGWESYEVYECSGDDDAWLTPVEAEPEALPEEEPSIAHPRSEFYEDDGWGLWGPPYSDDGWTAQYYAENGYYP